MWVDPKTLMKEMMLDRIKSFIEEVRDYFDGDTLDTGSILETAAELHEKMGILQKKFEDAMKGIRHGYVFELTSSGFAEERMGENVPGHHTGTAVIFGQLHHVEAIEVEYVNDMQSAVFRESVEFLDEVEAIRDKDSTGLGRLPYGDGALETVRIKGKECVLLIHPYRQ
jgi:hypothetical protein